MLQPDEGIQACGEIGVGRLMSVPDIVTAVSSAFHSGALKGQKVVITAGPTREAIDPVRYISNHSSVSRGTPLLRPLLRRVQMSNLLPVQHLWHRRNA